MSLSISVVIPVYNSAGYLRRCLQCLAESTLKPLECIVVDDGSTDDSAEVAREFGAKVVKTEGRSGPAHARNLGAREARGAVLFFIDADVCVYPDTILRLAANFEEEPDLDALIGSYDDAPDSDDFLSQYRNLMHCYVHQTSRREASTFWSGCGAVKRELFLEHGGFDESYGRPAIEDIELGYRLARAGRKMALDRHVLVKHLKKWSFWNILKTDVRDRGIPWTELILRDRRMPNDLNVQLSQRLSVALVFLMLGIAALTAIRWKGYFLTPLFAMVFFLLARYWVHRGTQKQSKGAIAVLSATVAGIVFMAYKLNMMGLLAPVLLGYLMLFVRDKYFFSHYRLRHTTGALLGVYMALSIVFIFQFLPNHILVFSFFSVLAILVTLNLKFYLFLAAKQGRFFALAAIPFHLLYHFYNGISFMVGFANHTYRRVFAARTPVLQPSNEQR